MTKCFIANALSFPQPSSRFCTVLQSIHSFPLEVGRVSLIAGLIRIEQ